jgi:glycosyltransferase involved in cell wall biosynthesis
MTLLASERRAGADAATGPRGVTVLVPVLNEAESVAPLVEQLVTVLGPGNEPFEILFVDDGSTDSTYIEIARAREREPAVRAIRFRRNFGKSAALAAGFREARGGVIVTIDGDLQDEPLEIPKLIAKLDEGYDLVSGWKVKRRDPLSKRLPSRLYNLTTRRLSGLDIHDFNCGLKAYRREVTETIAVYGELHRYIPALAHWAGFRVTELPVEHHARRHGASKFGGSRYLNGLLDLLGVMFLNSSERSPLHLFGRIGLATGAAGALICLVFLGQWILGSPLRVRPLMLFGVALILLGVQFVSMGFLGELIAKERGTRPYPIRDRLG